MTAIDARPRGVDLLAIRVGTTLERWGRERAGRRAPVTDPEQLHRLRAQVEADRAQREFSIPRIR